MPTLPNDESRRHIKGLGDAPVVEAEPLDPNSSIVETEDGGAEVYLPDEAEMQADPEFMENLAETMDTRASAGLGRELLELIEIDKEDRKGRDTQYEEGLRRTGLGDDAPGGAGFDGASKVVHPILAESCIDFAARAIKEIFPPSGPVKAQIIGEETDAKLELADRKVKYMNWQTTKQIAEYRSELEVLLTQLPMGGSQYKKWRHDDDLGRATCEFVPVDRILIPYACTSFYTAGRVTHWQRITRQEFDRRIQSGLYTEPSVITDVGSTPETSSSESANAKIEGKKDSGFNEDGLRDVYEIYTWRVVEDDHFSQGRLAPYIITVDSDSEQILGMYRNWKEGDEKLQKLDWIVEYKLIPWRGAYGIGLPHLIGGISGALTGSLRALLDAAHINNSQSLIKLKSGKGSGGNITVEPGEVKEIDQVAGVDDIRKTIMAMPYNQPSPVLFQLLDWLTAAGKGVISTTSEALENVGDRTPVGTTLALVEQGAVTYSSIHARMHDAQAKSLEILHRINATYLDEEETVEELGLQISRKDFQTSLDIVPVSDPNIFSEAQRFAQMQGVQQLRAMFPMLKWNDNELAQMMLRRMRLTTSEVERILPQPEKPKNLNPVAENMAALTGAPLLALPKQNHMAHLMTHLTFATSPVFGAPTIGTKMMAGMLEHCAQHISFYYADRMSAMTNYEQFVGQMPTARLEQTLAQANMRVLQQLQQELAPVMQLMGQVQQLAQQYAPKPMVDPAIEATTQVAMADINRKKELDQATLNLKAQELLQIGPQSEQLQSQIDMARNEADNLAKAQTEIAKNDGDNQTKLLIAAMQMQNQALMQRFDQQIAQQNAENDRRFQMLSTSLNARKEIALNERGHEQQMELNEQQAELQPAPTTQPGQ